LLQIIYSKKHGKVARDKRRMATQTKRARQDQMGSIIKEDVKKYPSGLKY